MSEAIYDEKIAPLLMQAGKLCEEHGLAMVAVVEYEPGKRGETRVLPDGGGLAMTMLSLLAKAGENVDSYMIWLTRYAREHGIDTSRSMYLSHFGSEH
jgi:hypothetical protein